MSRRERILSILSKKEGLTDRELTDLVDGKGKPPQAVNQLCRRLVRQGKLTRCKRDDGLIGNCLIKKTSEEIENKEILKYGKQLKNLSQLEAFGFMKAGEWFVQKGQLTFDLRSFSDEVNILYAYVVDGEVKYIGKSVQTLRKRVYLYKLGHDSQKANFRVNGELMEALKNSDKVDIYVLVPKIPLFYFDVEIDLAAGLENGMIKKFDPEWNKQK